MVAIVCLLLGSCAMPPAPPNARSESIVLIAPNATPYWNSIFRTRFGAWFYVIAQYPVLKLYQVLPQDLPPEDAGLFRLVVELPAAEKSVTGYTTPHVLAGTQVHYNTRVEIRATLVDPSGRPVAVYDDWEQKPDPDEAVSTIALRIAKRMRDAGQLSPEYLNPAIAQAQAGRAPQPPPPSVTTASAASADRMADLQTLITALRHGASQGDPTAQNLLGKHYAAGHGVLQDYDEAFALWNKAAAQGSIEAIFNLGTAYEWGRGTAKDPVQAYACYNVAAASGFPPAAERRAEVAKALSPEQMIEAQRVSREKAAAMNRSSL
jgi:hypothetical protein